MANSIYVGGRLYCGGTRGRSFYGDIFFPFREPQSAIPFFALFGALNSTQDAIIAPIYADLNTAILNPMLWVLILIAVAVAALGHVYGYKKLYALRCWCKAHKMVKDSKNEPLPADQEKAYFKLLDQVHYNDPFHNLYLQFLYMQNKLFNTMFAFNCLIRIAPTVARKDHRGVGAGSGRDG